MPKADTAHIISPAQRARTRYQRENILICVARAADRYWDEIEALAKLTDPSRREKIIALGFAAIGRAGKPRAAARPVVQAHLHH